MTDDKPADENRKAANEPAVDKPETDKPGTASPESGSAAKEIGGRGGADPTRFGDWEKDGRCVDF